MISEAMFVEQGSQRQRIGTEVLKTQMETYHNLISRKGLSNKDLRSKSEEAGEEAFFKKQMITGFGKRNAYFKSSLSIRETIRKRKLSYLRY